MIIEIKKVIEYDVKYLRAEMNVRYWEDATVNDLEDEHGALIPLRDGDTWDLLIDIDTGVIRNWPKDTTASVHYKICDEGTYTLLDENMNVVYKADSYVPSVLSPGGSGYGDYVIMNIDGNGIIENWNPRQIGYMLDDE